MNNGISQMWTCLDCNVEMYDGRTESCLECEVKPYSICGTCEKNQVDYHQDSECSDCKRKHFDIGITPYRASMSEDVWG